MVGMRNFQGTSEKRERSFISAFSICMTVPLKNNLSKQDKFLLISLFQRHMHRVNKRKYLPKNLRSRSSLIGVLRKHVLKIRSKFTGEHSYWSVISMKSHFSMGVLLQICCIFSERLFLRTLSEGCFWKDLNGFCHFNLRWCIWLYRWLTEEILTSGNCKMFIKNKIYVK